MQKEMDKLYSIAHQKHNSGDYQDCSKLIYTMTQETSVKWTDQKEAFIKKFDETLNDILGEENIRKIIKSEL